MIDALEQSKRSGAVIGALVTGIMGTAFMAGSVFAVTAEPPMVVLCILLAVPGFTGWILPYFLYRALLRKKSAKVSPLIEDKYEEIYEINCQTTAFIYLAGSLLVHIAQLGIAAQLGFDSCDQFQGIERLCNVVIRADVESQDRSFRPHLP